MPEFKVQLLPPASLLWLFLIILHPFSVTLSPWGLFTFCNVKIQGQYLACFIFRVIAVTCLPLVAAKQAVAGVNTTTGVD